MSGSNLLPSRRSYWWGRVLIAIADHVERGSSTVMACDVYKALLDFPVDPKLRQSVMAGVFLALRDSGFLEKAGAATRPRATRNAGHESVWMVTSRFDAGALREEAEGLISGSALPEDLDGQGRLPFGDSDKEAS